MRMVKNEAKYWEFIRQTRNHRENVQGFVQQHYITANEHAHHMGKNQDNYWICIDDSGSPMGYIGLINSDIRVAAHPDYKGMGVGTFMVNWLSSKFPYAQAKVKVENEASRKLFEKCGYKIKFYLLEKE